MILYDMDRYLYTSTIGSLKIGFLFLLIFIPVCNCQRPVIKKHPQDDYAAKDKAYTLSCTVEYTLPVPAITWYKNGIRVETHIDNPGSLHSITNNGDLFFLKFIADDAGSYYCNATNSFGSAISNNASLQLASIQDEFSVTPSDLSVSLNKMAKLLCEPPLGNPDPTIQWTKDGQLLDTGDSNSRVTLDYPLGNLLIHNVRRSDQGLYVCLAKNVAGTRNSNSARITVIEPPEITENPEHKIIHQGQSVSLKCVAKGDPPPKIDWIKVNDNLDSTRTHVSSNNSLNIDRVDPSDDGSYTCIASNSGGETRATAHLTVYTPPIFLQKPTSKTVAKNTTVTFRCVVSGNPPPLVHWSKEQDSLLLYARQKKDRFSVLEGATLQITNARPEDEGEYKCTANNVAGSNATSASLRVRDNTDSLPPPLITELPQNLTVAVNEDAELRCKASGNPSPYIRWHHNRSPVLVDSRISINRGNLRISDVMVTDSGEYTCFAISESGEAESSAYLNVVGVINNQVETLLPALPSKPVTSETDVNDTSVKLYWISNPSPADTVYYTIEYFTRQNKRGWVTSNVRTQNTWAVVGGLDAGTSYLMVVRAHNSYGSSEPSPISEYIKTKGAPRNMGNAWTDGEIQSHLENIKVNLISTIVLSSTALNVTWSIPEDDKQYIEGFHIQVSSSYRPETYIVYSSLSTYHIITNLQPYTQYRVSVSVFYYSFSAYSRSFQTATMFEDVPSGPPANVEVIDKPEYVHVSWTLPKLSHRNGEIIGYVIVCNAEDRRLSMNFSVNASVTSVGLDKLNRETSYKIGVAAQTRVGVGVISHMWPVEAQAVKDDVEWWKHVVIGVLGGLVWVVLCILIVCLYRRRKSNRKAKKQAAENNVVTVPLQSDSVSSPLFVQYPVSHGASYNASNQFRSAQSPQLMSQRSYPSKENNLDNYNDLQNPDYSKTFYNKSDNMSIGPYATTVILSNMPADRDESMIPLESPPNTLSRGGNVQNSCDSSCTDNNAARDPTVSSSSGEAPPSRVSPPVLPSFNDILPPPPLYPPPTSSVLDFTHTTPRVTQAGTINRQPPVSHCHTCQRGYHTHQTNPQIPRAHFMLDAHGRPFNPTLSHVHSFPTQAYRGLDGAATSPDYQLTYPSLCRPDGSHHYQTYMCSTHGHSHSGGSDSHDYAEPQFEGQDIGLYGASASMTPIAHQPIPPPHMLRRHQSSYPASHHSTPRVRQQFSVPAQLGAYNHQPQHLHNHAPLHQNSQDRRNSSDQELCPSCADCTDYEEPWSEQNWPLMLNQHHHHQQHQISPAAYHPQQQEMFDDAGNDDGEEEEEEADESQRLNIEAEDRSRSSSADTTSQHRANNSCSGSEDSQSGRRRRRRQRAQQLAQPPRSSSPYNGYSTDSSCVFIPRKPYPKSQRKKQMNTKPKNSKSLAVQVEKEELSHHSQEK